MDYKDKVDEHLPPRSNYVNCMLFHVEEISQHVSNTIGVLLNLIHVSYSEYLQEHANHEYCINFIVVLLLVKSRKATVNV